MRLAVPLAIALLAAALLAGCGGSSSSSSDSSANGSTAAPKTGAPNAPVASGHSCATHAAEFQGLRVFGVSCGQALKVMHAWQGKSACSFPAGASRSSCSSGSYRCLEVKNDRGVAVSCSYPGHAVAFTRRG